MKTRFFSLLILLFTALATYAADKITEVYTLDHQMSSHCEKKITDNLRYEKGVKDLKVSLKENTITISFDPEKTDSEKIIRAFKKIGFNAMHVNEDDCSKASESCCGKCDKHK